MIIIRSAASALRPYFVTAFYSKSPWREVIGGEQEREEW
jgi:hypothetical protein